MEMEKKRKLTLVQDTQEEELFHIRVGELKMGEVMLSEYDNCITIDNIEIDEAYQGRGYGKEVVSLLKNKPGITMLIGDSVPEALPFWNRMGAIFDSVELENVGETGHALVGFEICW